MGCPLGFKTTKFFTHDVPLSPLNQGVSEEVVIAKILLKLPICCPPKTLSSEVLLKCIALINALKIMLEVLKNF